MALQNVPPKVIIYKQNSQIFEIDGLKDQSGNYLNAATVTMTLQDQNGTGVPGIINVTMVYVAASNGIYQGQIPSTFAPKAGQGYVLVVDSQQGSAIGHWEFIVEVDIRRS